MYCVIVYYNIINKYTERFYLSFIFILLKNTNNFFFLTENLNTKNIKNISKKNKNNNI